ncbi:hypothetical protein PINS_up010258 [Pythium insidiosum]|nr:hypothetical protein PINS_up010258 [Pythium insidiosum]
MQRQLEDDDYVEQQQQDEVDDEQENERASDEDPRGSAVSASSLALNEDASATPSTPGLSAEEMLMERFRLHKQHRREREAFLRNTRRDAAMGSKKKPAKTTLPHDAKFKSNKAAAPIATATVPSKPLAPSPPTVAAAAPPTRHVDLTRVDHNNRPHRWKDMDVIMHELEQRSFQKMLKDAEPVRPFPGKLRKRIFNVSDEEKEDDESEDDPHGQSRRTASSSASTGGRPSVDDDEYLKIDQSQFPLHLFDSDEFETHAPTEWLSVCATGFSPYYFKGDWRWRACAVQSYDADKQKYLIQFHGSDRRKHVRRINLRFETESPELFQRRIDAAVERREVAKAQLRFDHFLTKQSGAELRAMSRELLARVHRRVVHGLPECVTLADQSPSARTLRALTDATIQEYARSMKKAVLFHRLRSDAELQRRYETLNLHAPPPSPAVPAQAKVAIPAHAFERHRRRVASLHFTSSPPLLAVFLKMYAGWEKTFQRTLLVHVSFPTSSAANSSAMTAAGGNGASSPTKDTSHLEGPFRLLDFKALQLAHQNKAAEILLIDWRRTIIENIIDNLQDHFDFFVADVNAYRDSRLQRLVTNVEVRMAAQLRAIVRETIREWVAFVQRNAPLSADAEEEATQSHADALLEQRRSATDPWRSHRNSLFDVQLALASRPSSSSSASSAAATDSAVVVEPSTEEIISVLLEPLDHLVACVHEVEAIDCEILSLLPLERRRLLNLEPGSISSSNSGDRSVVAELLRALADAKRDITAMVQLAMAAAQQLAALYTKYTDALAFDAPRYLAQLKAATAELSSGDYLSEICRQIRRFHELATRIDVISFDSVAFPLVCVSTTALKATLKARVLVHRDALLESLVRDARERNMDITLRYEAILRRILEKPSNEAQLAALKAFVNDSKSVIAGMIREVDDVHLRLAALDEFAYKLNVEDLRLAYSTKEWPLRVAHAAESCDSALEEDKIRMMDRLALEKEAFRGRSRALRAGRARVPRVRRDRPDREVRRARGHALRRAAGRQGQGRRLQRARGRVQLPADRVRDARQARERLRAVL